MVKSRTERYLTPAESTKISGHITLLLAHYFHDAKVPPAVLEGLTLQWLKVLENLPEWAIEQAVTEYLADDAKGRKPVPGQIKSLADKACSKYRALIVQCDRVIDAQIEPENDRETPEEREASRQRVAEIVAQARRNLAGNFQSES